MASLRQMINLYGFIRLFKQGYSGFSGKRAVEKGYITTKQLAYLKRRFPNDILGGDS